MTSVQSPASAEVAACRAVLEQMTQDSSAMNYSVRFWDGSQWTPDENTPNDFTLVLNHPGSLRKMFWPPNDLSVGEAFRFDDFDVEGDMIECVGFLRQLAQIPRSLGNRLSLGWKLWRLPSAEGQREGRSAARLSGKRESRARLRDAVGYHYDVSNEFFGLWLDRSMMYTCAYFETEDDSIDKAQDDKLDYICRKLRLREGERFLDIGCGWGGLVEYAGREHGANSVGVTLSRAQCDYASSHIDQEGLADRCRVEFGDFRDFDESTPFDKIATVEVLEHGSDDLMRDYFEKVSRLLKPGGMLYIQAITLTGPVGMVKWRKFNQNYVFPDGQLRPISSIQREGENAGLEVRDVEGLREHYALTLRRWLTKMEKRHDECLQHVDEATYRTFRMYLAGACSAYEAGTYNLHQVVFVKPDSGKSRVPLRRAGWIG